MKIYERIADWIVPVLLGVVVFSLQELSDLSRSLAVTISKMEDHQRRMEIIERLCFGKK